jgi:acyl-homoserine-lactone acylase
VWCVLLLLGPALALSGCEPLEKPYVASIRRTTFGIPHILAEDWGSLGYGYGYAFAQDNYCVLMREVLVATASLSRSFGPDGGNLESDLFYAYWSSEEVAERFFAALAPDLQDLGRGYVAGLNRYLADTGKENLPADCRDADWVHPIDILDLFRVFHKLVTRAGAPNLQGFIVNAAPPGGGSAGATAPAPSGFAARETPAVVAALEQALPKWEPEKIGSNMIGLGYEATENERGMLLVNPHFPWLGPLRFYQVHLTLPGELNSMGGSIVGSPLPNIGFNQNVAWSHTVSAARRFVLFDLQLVPGDPTAYFFDGQVEPMTTQTVSVDVLQPDGSLQAVTHTFYESRFGPVASLLFPLDWTTTQAYAVSDPNRDNDRIFNQYLEMNQAENAEDLLAALDRFIALPWVNTVGVDRFGSTFYADVGAVSNVTDTKLNACGGNFLGLFFLDGSSSACDLGQEPDAPAPGILGSSQLPRLVRTDWVQNSNDSYWLTRPDAPLEGFSPLLGGERQEQGLRTRLGIQQIEERLAEADGRPGIRFSLDDLRNTVFGNRNLSAELAADDVVSVCQGEGPVDVGGTPVDVSQACTVLAGWDGRNLPTSVGTHVWKEFWTRFDDSDAWEVPFDPDDAANTPRDLRESDPVVRARILQALAGAVERIARLGVPLDAAWGEVQFEVKNGDPLPISGGSGGEGVYNAIGGPRTDGLGYTPITGGSSIVEVITFDERGPVAEGVLTYSQSSDPANPHFGDQTRHLFSQLRMQRLPFHEDEIADDPNLEVLILEEGPEELRARAAASER